jgi:hypothetical protein
MPSKIEAQPRWIGEDITDKQQSLIDKIVKATPSLRMSANAIDDKWDAHHFIARNIDGLNAKESSASTDQPKPITDKQNELIAHIHIYLDRVLFTGKTHADAYAFIGEHYENAMKIKNQIKTSSCKKCGVGDPQFHDLTETGSATPTLCLNCHHDSRKPQCKKCNKVPAKWFDDKYSLIVPTVCTDCYELEESVVVAPEKVQEVEHVTTCRLCGRSAEYIGAEYLEQLGLTQVGSLNNFCSMHFSNFLTNQNKELSSARESGKPLSSLAQKYLEDQKTHNPSNTTIKEENNMLKGLGKVFGEFGKDTSGRFAMSFQGTAVKVNGTYVTFDGDSTTDVMELIIPGGENMLFKMPATIDQIDIGDVILNNDRVLFVKDVNNDGNIVAIDPVTNDIITHSPRKNVFGIQFYTRVTSLMNFGQDGGGMNPMMLMMMSSGQKDTYRSPSDNKMAEMLPLMMMMQGQNGGNNSMQQMLPMMMMSGGSGNMNEMLPFLMMNQSVGGDNPFSALFPVVAKKKRTRTAPTTKASAKPRKPRVSRAKSVKADVTTAE